MKYFFIFSLIILITNCTTNQNDKDVLLQEFVLKYKEQRTKHIDSVYNLNKQLDSIALITNDNNLLAFSKYTKGIYFNLTSNFPLALKYFEDAKKSYSDDIAYDSLRAMCSIALADVHINIGNFVDAVNNAILSKEIFEKRKLKIGVELANLSLAKTYQAKGEINTAKQLLQNVAMLSNIDTKLYAFHTLSNIYGEQGLIDSALIIDNKIIGELINTDKQLSLSPFYNNKALCFTEKNLFDSAIHYFKKSFILDSLNGNIKNMAANYEDLGNLYLNQNNITQANYYFDQGIQLSKRVGRKISALSGYKGLVKLYKKSGNYQKALQYNDSVKQIKEQLDNVTLNTRIKELNLIYETNKKEQKIQQQEITIIKKNGLIILGFCILGFLTIFAYNYTKKQKFKQQLQLQEERFNQEKEKTNAIIIAEEKERQRISRDLHDNMGAYTSALIANVQELKVKNSDIIDTSKMESNANQILVSLRETIWILNNKEIAIQEFNDNFKNYCFKVLQNFEKINFSSNEEITENRILKANTALQLTKIMQEVVQNTIKHSNASVLQYNIASANKAVTITLKDNGNGFDLNNALNGNGLSNMEYRANEIGFMLKLESEINSGTTITISNIYS